MSDTYVPGFSHALQRYAVGGRVLPDSGQDYAPIPTIPGRTPTKPELAANLNALLAAQQAGQNPEMDPVEARLVAAMQQPTYSPEFQGYLTSVNDYMAGLGAPEIGRFRNTIPLSRTVAGAGSGVTAFNPEAELAQYAARPAEQNVNYYATLYGGSDKDPTGALDIGYNTPVVLVNNRTGEIVSQGIGFQAAQDIMKAAKGLTSSDGGDANWAVYAGTPGSTDLSTYKSVMSDIPDQSMLGQFADLALTSLGAALGGPLGAMAGSGISSAAQGRSLGGALKNAALAGGLTYLGGQLGPTGGASSGASGGLGSGVGGAGGGVGSGAGAVGAGLGNAADGIITVVGNAGKVLSGIGSGLGGALAGLGSSLGGAISSGAGNITQNAGNLQNGQTPGQTGANGPITVVANTGGGALTPAQIAAAVGAGGLGAGAATSGASASGSGAQPSSGTQQQPTPQPTTQQPVNPNEIVVNANPAPNLNLGTVGAITGAAGLGGLITSPVTLPSTPAPQLPPAEKKGILDQIGELSTLDKIRLAGLGLGTIGDLFSGGGGSSSGGTIPGGLNGGLNPVFSKTLPTANLPAATPRTAQDLDYYRYGYGPQQSFFTNAPAGLPNTSQAYTGYAEGGEVGESGHEVSPFAVGGAGDGRDDKIPAMLSDGEYVMDAETVALLGNGSSKAGAKMLDKFRVNVRKQKGRKLAKGEFSDNAKAPEHYLKGRK